MQAVRLSFGCVTIRDRIYLCGGYLGTSVTDTVEAFHIPNNPLMHDVDTLQTPAAGAASFSLDGNVYFAASSISTIKVLWPLVKSSYAPTRVKTRSIIPISALSAGT